MRTIDLRGKNFTPAELLAAVPRATAARAAALDAAEEIVRAVRHDGESALREQAARFDRVTDHEIRVPQSHIDDAVAGLDPAVRTALEEAIARVREGSAAQVPAPRETDIAPGARVTQRWQPVGRAGVYVPGGKAVYPSSVIMNVVPAQVAGVPSLALCSPPQADCGGRVHPTILAVAGLLGVDEVYAIGGAGAIGALAHGVAALGLDPVDVVTGPGNNFVAAAKRVVAGVVGTDAEAGATEILIAADDTADARLVAYDLISQAEHDEQASAVLVTASTALAQSVQQPSSNGSQGRDPAQPSAWRRRSMVRSRRSCSSTIRDDGARSATRTARSTSNCTSPKPATRPPRTRTPEPCSSDRSPRSASATTWPAATTCSPPAGSRGTPPGSAPTPSCGRSRSSNTTATRWASSPTASSRSPRPSRFPRTVRRSMLASPMT